MLDFPNSPTDQQLWGAPNGVTYQFNASPSPGYWAAVGGSTTGATISSTPPVNPFGGQIWWQPDLARAFIWYFDGNSYQWVPLDPGTGALATGADFFSSGAPALGTTAQVTTMPVISGNSGSWYSTGTGRFIPPAGRYNLFAAIGGYSNAGAIGINGAIRKNGVTVGQGPAVNTPGANQWGVTPHNVQADANGSDYFDFLVSCNPAATGSFGWFGAHPVGQIVGTIQPGPSVPYLYNEVVSIAGATDMRPTFPSNAKKIEIEFAIGTSDSSAQTFYVQWMQGGAIVGGTNYTYQMFYGTGTTVAAAGATGQGYFNLGSALIFKGVLRPSFLYPSGYVLEGQGYAQGASGARYAMGWSGDTGALGGITALRLGFVSGTTLAVGSYARSYVVQ
jgi:hypothetical protein